MPLEPKWKREVREGIRALVKDYAIRNVEQKVIGALEAAHAASIPTEGALAAARAEGRAEGWAEGWAAGAEAMREACIGAVDDEESQSIADGWDSDSLVLGRLREAIRALRAALDAGEVGL